MPQFCVPAIIIGAESASFVMLKYLVERLRVMICPKWIDTRVQPIAVKDVLAYLTGCLLDPDTAGKTFDIGGPEVLTYREMIHQYTEVVGISKRDYFLCTCFIITPCLLLGRPGHADTVRAGTSPVRRV